MHTIHVFSGRAQQEFTVAAAMLDEFDLPLQQQSSGDSFYTLGRLVSNFTFVFHLVRQGQTLLLQLRDFSICDSTLGLFFTVSTWSPSRLRFSQKCMLEL